MTRKEIKKAIENGESVWVANKYCYPYEVNLTNNHYIDIADNKESLMLAHLDDFELIDYLEYIFETKEKAQHYHDHANITRIEQLPFLTWEEFLEERHLSFIGKNEIEYMLCIFGDKIDLAEHRACSSFVIKEWHATEANFYKAYDECVRLFRGEE